MSEDSIERDGIKWGEPIEGDMPEGLDPMTPVINKDGVELIAAAWMRKYAPYRLPADHPYYAQEKADEAFAAKLLDADVRGVMRRRERQEDAATTAINPALVERMVALVRRVASDEPGGRDRYRTDAKALIAEMVPASVQRFQCDNPLWHLMDRAELIERVLAWKETNA